MAIRRWRAYPDQVLTTPEGDQIAVVSRDAQVEAVMDAIALCDRSGGGFTVVYGRRPTQMPGEALTTGIVVMWNNRTDAPKLQPEHRVDVLPDEEGPQPVGVVEEEVFDGDGEPDGLDPSTLEEEDTSAIPVDAR